MFLKYKAEMENQLNRKIKRLRSDREGEYDSNTLNAFCGELEAFLKLKTQLPPLNQLPTQFVFSLSPSQAQEPYRLPLV